MWAGRPFIRSVRGDPRHNLYRRIALDVGNDGRGAPPPRRPRCRPNAVFPMSIDIDPLSDAAGLTVTDHIENTQFEVYTDRPVEPAASPEDAHYFPVDASVTVETGAIEIPRVAVVETRCCATARCSPAATPTRCPRGRTTSGSTPTRRSCTSRSRRRSPCRRRSGRPRIDLDAPAEVTLGFRSLHQVPAGTIETPTDPESLMDAVSLLGSALQTTSPERSFPTLRGHPPLIEPGEEFRVPDRVEPVDSGIRIVVPPEYRYLYPVVSLAYYFAADVVPGDPPGSRATAGRTLWSPTSNGGPVRCSDRRSTLTVSRAHGGFYRSISTSARPPTSTSTGAGCTTSRWRSDSASTSRFRSSASSRSFPSGH